MRQVRTPRAHRVVRAGRYEVALPLDPRDPELVRVKRLQRQARTSDPVEHRDAHRGPVPPAPGPATPHAGSRIAEGAPPAS